MIGKRFGRLTVIAEGERAQGRRENRWICQCDCGNITNPVSGNRLRSGDVKSCGCYKREQTIRRSTTHDLCHSRLYRIYFGMKDRCTNPHNEHYARYGGRGIQICVEWLNSFEAFYKWAMSHGYADNLTLDRKENDKGYCPENCRWTTNEVQANNRWTNIVVEINGESKTLAQWARESGIKYRTIHARYNRGWTGESLLRKV